VGKLTGVPAMVGEVREKVVEDGEASGTGGVAGGGSNQRRRLRRPHGAPACNWRTTVDNRRGEVVEEIE
jgi:hypothetical protein